MNGTIAETAIRGWSKQAIKTIAPMVAAAIVTWMVQTSLTQAEAEATRLYWVRYVKGVELQQSAKAVKGVAEE